jgi:hypothetical protein
MALEIKIKEEFINKRLAFGKSADPLYKRTEQELIELGIMAHESKSPSILRLFEKLPDLDLLKKVKTDQQLQKIAPAVVKEEEKAGSENLTGKFIPGNRK